MEPITVLELQEWTIDHMEKHGRVRVAVMMPPQLTPPLPGEAPVNDPPRVVDIWCEKFYRGEQKLTLLTTRDDENAMLLKSVFLPGQRAALQEHERNAFARGFLEALYRVGRLDE